MNQDNKSRQSMQKIEVLIDKVEQLSDPEARALTLELVQSLMELHGEGINRMLEVVSEDAAGQSIIERLGDDEFVAGLLVLYGLHPLDLETRLARALEKVRPYLKSHGGNVAIASIEDGVVRLKLEGNCNGCASSAMTMKLAIEDAIYEASPDIVELFVEGVVEERKGPPLVPLQITRNQTAVAAANGGWQQVSGVASLGQGAVEAIDVGGKQVLFCRLNGDYYAYNCNCSKCGATLKGARLEATAVSCPDCGEQFDISRAGRSLGGSDLQLQPFPLLFENGEAKIALPSQI